MGMRRLPAGCPKRRLRFRPSRRRWRPRPTTGESAFDPGVGTYVDGVYLPRGGKIMDVVDIEQIEVLRGPQGTLFGKNTLGGAINMTTVKPHRDVEGFAFVRPGSRGQIRTRSMVNLPIDIGWLEDKLFSRLAFASANDGGWVENETWDNEQSNLNSLSFLGSLRFVPTDDLTIDLSGSWDRSMSHRRGRRCAFQGGGALTPLFPTLEEACRASEPFRVRTNDPNNDYQESYGVWGTIAYDLGPIGLLDAVGFKSITSWREQTSDKFTSEDIDATEVFVTHLEVLPGQPGFQQIQQELQLNGQAWDDRIALLAGFFSFWDKGGEAGGNGGGLTTTGTGFRGLGQSQIDNFTWALFGQITVDPTDWLSLTGGLRYTEDTKRNSIVNQTLTEAQLIAVSNDPSSISRLLAEEGASVESGEKTFSKWTPMASVALFAPQEWISLVAVDQLMTYFTYSQGFRGGGFNTVIDPLQLDLLSFGPETIENFEIGAKAIALEERLTFNLSLFHMDFEDIQVLQNVVFPNPDDPDQPFIRRITTNAAKARSRGLEAEIQAIPIDGLQVTGNIGLLDAEYTEFVDAGGNDRSGNRFGEPRFTSFLAAQYSFPLAGLGPEWLEGWITPRLQWSYTGGRYFGALNNQTAYQRGYNKLDARLSYDFLGDRAQLALWGTNITDEEYLAFAEDLVGVFGITTQGYAAPAAWGAEMSYRF
jgi:iron complex outermembrane receptor protein